MDAHGLTPMETNLTSTTMAAADLPKQQTTDNINYYDTQKQML
jgi:hypothetical protein